MFDVPLDAHPLRAQGGSTRPARDRAAAQAPKSAERSKNAKSEVDLVPLFALDDGVARVAVAEIPCNVPISVKDVISLDTIRSDEVVIPGAAMHDIESL
jgi:hypothetical protein